MISLSDIFIHRPVMTVLTMLTILLFGLIAYKELPVSDLPNVDYPTINVTATTAGSISNCMRVTPSIPNSSNGCSATIASRRSQPLSRSRRR